MLSEWWWTGGDVLAKKKMIDKKPKLRKKANKAMNAMGQIIDTAQYMFK